MTQPNIAAVDAALADTPLDKLLPLAGVSHIHARAINNPSAMYFELRRAALGRLTRGEFCLVPARPAGTQPTAMADEYRLDLSAFFARHMETT